MRRSCFRFLSFALALCMPALASAQDQQSTGGKDQEGWSFRLAPYAWAAGLNGDIGYRGVSTHVNASIGEVIDHAEGGIMLTGEARYNRWALITDFIYADLADRRWFDQGLIEQTKVQVQEYIWTEAVGYRAYQCGQSWIDLLTGFRLFSLDQTLSVQARDRFAPSGDVSAQTSLDRTWVDPIVGIRSAFMIYDGWAIRTEGDVGGFNSSSKFTWQAMAALGYDATESTRVLVGYRGLGYNHDREGFKYDTVMHGPMIGVGVGF